MIYIWFTDNRLKSKQFVHKKDINVENKVLLTVISIARK